MLDRCETGINQSPISRLSLSLAPSLPRTFFIITFTCREVDVSVNSWTAEMHNRECAATS